MFSESVNTIEKWSRTTWQWAAPSIIWITSVEHSDIHIEQNLVHKFHVQDYEFLRNATFSKDYGVGIERMVGGSFAVSKFLTAEALETRTVLRIHSIQTGNIFQIQLHLYHSILIFRVYTINL